MYPRCVLFLACLGLVFAHSPLLSQTEYAHRRSLKDVRSDGYHRISLLPEVLDRIQPSMADLRLYRQDAPDQALIEVPYLLDVPQGYVSRKERPVKLLNERSKGTERIQVIRRESEEKANRITVVMNEKSYDVKLTLESSSNRLNWTPVGDNLRIRAQVDDLVNFQANEIRFKDNGDKFLRIKVNDPSVEITDVKLWYVREGAGATQPYATKDQQDNLVGETKDTELLIRLAGHYPVSSVTLKIGTNGDYIRPIEISYLPSDQELSAASGWRPWSKGVLNNLTPSTFSAKSVYAYAIKIKIANQYDLPLDIRDVQISGPAYALIADLEATGSYALFYGYDRASAPGYKLGISKRNLPKDIVPASLGSEGKVPDVLVAAGGGTSKPRSSGRNTEADEDEETESDEEGESAASLDEDTENIPTPASKPNIWLWGGLGAVLALIAFLVMRRRRNRD